MRLMGQHHDVTKPGRWKLFTKWQSGGEKPESAGKGQEGEGGGELGKVNGGNAERPSSITRPRFGIPRRHIQFFFFFFRRETGLFLQKTKKLLNEEVA